jgi:hypothetical protein
MAGGMAFGGHAGVCSIVTVLSRSLHMAGETLCKNDG